MIQPALLSRNVTRHEDNQLASQLTLLAGQNVSNGMDSSSSTIGIDVPD